MHGQQNIKISCLVSLFYPQEVTVLGKDSVLFAFSYKRFFYFPVLLLSKFQ